MMFTASDFAPLLKAAIFVVIGALVVVLLMGLAVGAWLF